VDGVGGEDGGSGQFESVGVHAFTTFTPFF